MELLRKLGGTLLLLLAAAKVIGIVVLRSNGESEKTAWWFAKQIVYSTAFFGIGAKLLWTKSKSESS